MISLRTHKMSRLVGLLVAALAWFDPLHLVFLAPVAFALMGPGHWAVARWAASRRAALAAPAKAVPAASGAAG